MTLAIILKIIFAVIGLLQVGVSAVTLHKVSGVASKMKK